MIKKLSAMLVAGHCFAISFAQPLQTKTVTITASLINADSTTPKAMALNFLNPFIKGRKSAAFNQAGWLSSSEEMLFTHNMTIQYNNVFINLYVQPGDSVHLQINGAFINEPDFKWLSISGDHAHISTQLNKWHRYFSTNIYKKFDLSVSLPTMLDSVRNSYAQCISILEEYAKQHNLDPIVKEWAANDIRYTVSYWASDYMTTKDSATGKPLYHHALFADPLFDQYNPAGFQSMMFPYHLWNYAYTLLKTDSTIAQSAQQGFYQKAASKAINLLIHEPASLSRDYMLFHALSTYINKSPLLLDSLSGLENYFTDPVTYRYLLRYAHETANPDLKEQAIPGITYLTKNNSRSTLPAVEIFDYLSKRHPGKILYVDIYATWCVPCLEEMAYLPVLKKEVDSSKVVFINLCLQSDEANWIGLIKKRSLSGENYFLNDDASKLFMGLYKIGGFPTYMLFDKKGKLRTANAPRPSEKEGLLKTITKLLSTNND
ncbi:MAG TPA: TlpA disulfide reductase family protein [Chitinophagaceae bacterium]|nr:TlpA disulfide reductase family protein [Chitinophagaceae bacterium]